jgi:hypothetical protein
MSGGPVQDMQSQSERAGHFGTWDQAEIGHQAVQAEEELSITIYSQCHIGQYAF